VEGEPGAARLLSQVQLADLVVLPELCLVGSGLGLAERLRIAAHEQLEHAKVAQLGHLARRLPAPRVECLASLRRQRVVLAAAASLLTLLVQQAGLCKALGLGVELGVLERPEMADREPDGLLQVVGRALPAEELEQAEDDDRG